MTSQLQLQLQLQLYCAASNHFSIHWWVRSAIHHSQESTSPICFLSWNFRHRLVRYILLYHNYIIITFAFRYWYRPLTSLHNLLPVTDRPWTSSTRRIPSMHWGTRRSLGRSGDQTRLQKQWRWPYHAPELDGFHAPFYLLVIEHSYWKWPFIVDFPVKTSDFHSYVKLPEGMGQNLQNQKLGVLRAEAQTGTASLGLSGAIQWVFSIKA